MQRATQSVPCVREIPENGVRCCGAEKGPIPAGGMYVIRASAPGIHHHPLCNHCRESSDQAARSLAESSRCCPMRYFKQYSTLSLENPTNWHGSPFQTLLLKTLSNPYKIKYIIGLHS